MSLPSRVGRYEIVDRLGRGGMGVVYLARDPELRRSVAIKVLSGYSDNTDDGVESRERFAREARSVAALSHNHIVTIYDVGEDHGRPFIAMQFLDGETLAEFIRRKPEAVLGRKLRLMVELCMGLGYAHRSGIIHRDIKPANLMITREGGLKILDFGLARAATEETSGGLMGTPHYMSPEQVTGQTLDPRSDIFSVGAVLYELLTYRKAFPGDAPHLVLQNILQASPTAIRDLVPSLGPEVERIVVTALEKDPARRYQNLQVMEADLQRILDRSTDTGQDSTLLIRPDAPVGPGGVGRSSPSGAQTPSHPSKIPNLDAIAGRRKTQIDAHLKAASEHLERREYESAIEQCEYALVLDPQEAQALQFLELAHRRVEDSRVRAWLEDARAEVARGSLSQAEALIAESLRLRPDSVEARQLQAAIRDQRQERERQAERARRIAAALERARTLLAEGALEAASRAASEALGLDSAHAEALALRDEVRAAIDERERQEALEREVVRVVTAAREAADNLDFAPALELLRSVAPTHPLVRTAREEIEAARGAFLRRQEEEKAAARQRAAERAETIRLQEVARQAQDAQAELRRLEEQSSEQTQSFASDLQMERDRQAERERTVVMDRTVLIEPVAIEPPVLPPADVAPAVHKEEPPPPVHASEDPVVRTVPEFRAVPDDTTATGFRWSKVAIIVVAAVVLLVVAVNVWRSIPAAPEDFSRVLAQAEAEYRQGNTQGAVVLIGGIPSGAPERTMADELLARIERDRSGVGTLVLDALPWAEIVSIVDGAGEAAGVVARRHDAGGALVAAGRDEVTLRQGPKGPTRKLPVTVAAGVNRPAAVDFGKIDAREYFRRLQW